ncbi:MAG: DUF3526 domain-containing protein [Saprospiraceae bacterium]|nr:DUF3526 domain-containing protein [Saprospiraceae bacterium]
MSVILGIAIKLTLLTNQVPLVAHWNEIGTILAITFTYLLFWFALALLVNLLGKSSANNAISLLAIWIFLVLLIPTVINQTANSIYPVPSRAQLINDMRSIKAETEKEQDKILVEYLRNHPELAVNQDSTSDNWYQSYFASQDLVKEKMEPILAGYDQQIRKQQQWVNNLRFLSPAIILQDGLNELAQTSTKHYESYRTQVIAFSEKWRSFFLPMIFKEEKVTKATFAQLPKFEYNTADISSNVSINLMSLLILGIGMLAIAFSIFRVRGSESLLTMS